MSYPPKAKTVYKGRIFSVLQWQQKMYDGTYSTFERIKRPSTVTVIPIKSDGKIILTRQEQPAVKPFITLPGGVVDEHENPLNAAQRELLEETGYEASEWILWDQTQISDKIEWVIYTYIAKKVRRVSEPTPDNGEKIELFDLSFDEFINLTRDENFRDIEITLKIHRAQHKQSDMNKIRKLFWP